MTRWPTLAVLVFLFNTAGSLAQSPRVTEHTDMPPAELADPIDAVLATGGQRIAVGSETLEFWWVKSLPLRAESTQVSWTAVEEGTLVGAVKLSAPYPDVRGMTLKAGVYTLRYEVQPADDSHLGVSPHREFLLLSPGAVDTSAAALGHDATITLSRLSIGTSHPAPWSLDPPIASEAPLSIHETEAGFRAVVFAVPVSRDGNDVGMLRFGLILVGQLQS